MPRTSSKCKVPPCGLYSGTGRPPPPRKHDEVGTIRQMHICPVVCRGVLFVPAGPPRDHATNKFEVHGLGFRVILGRGAAAARKGSSARSRSVSECTYLNILPGGSFVPAGPPHEHAMNKSEVQGRALQAMLRHGAAAAAAEQARRGREMVARCFYAFDSVSWRSLRPYDHAASKLRVEGRGLRTTLGHGAAARRSCLSSFVYRPGGRG